MSQFRTVSGASLRASIPAWTVIWAAGVAPNPLLSELNLPCDERGYLICRQDLRVKDQVSLWGIGDCAINPDPDGDPYPPTAQHAIHEGRQAAENIVRALRQQPTEPLVYRSKGMMAPLGQHQGVARIFGHKISGLSAWFLWRTFYLLKMPGFGRSLRVAMDWTLDWFFRRDYVQLGLHGRPHSSAVGTGTTDNDDSNREATSARGASVPSSKTY